MVGDWGGVGVGPHSGPYGRFFAVKISFSYARSLGPVVSTSRSRLVWNGSQGVVFGF